MALLQLSSPTVAASTGSSIAQLYDALQQPTLADCQQQLCQQLSQQLQRATLDWQVSTPSGQLLSHCGYMPAEQVMPPLPAAQRAHLATLPLQPILHPLTGAMFSAFPHPCSLRQRCPRTGLVHTFFITSPTQAGPQSLLARRLSHLTHIDALYRLNSVRRQCLGAQHASALYDATARRVAQSPAFQQQRLLTGPAKPVSNTTSTQVEIFREIPPQLYRLQPQNGFTVIDTLTLPDDFQGLSPRQKQICFYLDRALSNQQIAAALNSAEKTLENQLTTLYRKLAIRSRAQLIHRLCETATGSM